MKYIIAGLGNFGSALAEKLTLMGNEVIGIDTNYEKIDLLKEKITDTICMDSTDQYAVSGLPIKETDVVIIAMGEKQGINILASALFKNLKAKYIISRAITPLHESILEAIGVNEIIHPEEESAERWAKKLSLTDVIDSFELNANYSIVEAKVPKEMIGKTIKETQIRDNFNILILTVIKKEMTSNFLGISKKVDTIKGVAYSSQKLEDDDILVLFGLNHDIKKFLKKETF